MKLDTRFKEAFKVALAFAMVYGIALKLSWMNPSWAAFGVAMIALPTAGQSIHKGIDRLAGTIPGCISALVILSLAPQNRWLFMFLAASWVFFIVYMMIRSKNHQYFWNVAGFVCLIILLTGPGSSDSDFEHAVFRTLETAMGVTVYTLVTVFIWPCNNAGAIKTAIDKLASTFRERNRSAWNVMSGQGNGEELQDLHKQSVQQLDQLAQALIAGGSESYEVHELRPAFERFHQLSKSLMGSQDRLETSLDEMARIDVKTLLPGVQRFMNAQDERLEKIRQLLNGGKLEPGPGSFDLNADKDAVHRLSGFDLAALTVIKNELEKLDSLTSGMLKCIQGIQADTTLNKPDSFQGPRNHQPGLWLPVPDRDHFMGALFAMLCTAGGFLVWIFINPPGHAAWIELPAIVAMMVGVTPQVRASTFFKPFAVMLTLALTVYVFILPQLTSFAGLGLVLFLCAFIACYFFSGIARLAGLVSIINMITIENQQTYDFAAQANALVFTLLAFLFVYVISYLLSSPRPEKAVLKMTERFFRSAQFMVSRMTRDPVREMTWVDQWKIAYYRNEMETLPAKLSAWGNAIDHKLFPNTTQEQLDKLVTSLQSLVYRIDELLGARSSTRISSNEERELTADLMKWGQGIEHMFEQWSIQPEARVEEKRAQHFRTRLSEFESKTETFLARIGNDISEQSGENFYRLLGGFRGVSEAAVSYTEVARSIDWIQWREERFS